MKGIKLILFGIALILAGGFILIGNPGAFGLVGFLELSLLIIGIIFGIIGLCKRD